MFSKNKIFGLQGKVALRESFIVVIASVLTFLPLNFQNVNTLILVPVFCTIISCNISAFSSLMAGSVVIIATLMSGFVQYLYSIIFGKVWPTFIVTFFFTFIFYCYVVRGGRWMNGLAIKKCLLDIIIVYYFTVGDINKEIKESVIGSLFIMASITVCALLFPSLATRLFKKKIKKTLDTIRTLFRGVGYSVENKLYNTFTHSHSVNNIYQQSITPSDLNDHPQISQETPNPLNQSQFIINPNTSPSQNNNNNNNISTSPKKSNLVQLPKNTSFTFPLMDLREMEHSLSGIDEGIMIEEHLEKLKESNNINDIDVSPKLDLINTSPPLQDNVKLSKTNEIVQLPLTRSTLNDGKDPIQVNIPSSNVNSSNSTPINNSNGLDGAIELDSIKQSSKKRPLSILSTSVPVLSEEELKLLQVKLTEEVNRLTLLFGECKQERWNLSLVESYKSILSLFDSLMKQLISLRVSIEFGFSRHASQELLLPCLPFVNSLVEEVYLQIGLMIQLLESPFTLNDENITIEKSILENSFEETSDLVLRLQDFYKQLVFEYQKGGFPTLQQSEICRLHFFIFGIMEFTSQQNQLLNVIVEIRQRIRRENVRIELLRYGLTYIVFSLPKHYFRLAKEFIVNMSSYIKGERSWYKELIEYFKIIFLKNNKWKFPFQVAVALISSLIAFHYFDGKSNGNLHIHGVWTCATVVLVMSPSVGATILRGAHRTVGTALGGLVGFLVSWLVNQSISSPWKEIIILVFQFLWISLNSFVQQDTRFSYAGSVSGLTFILIVNGQYLTQESDIWYAINRTFHIVLGVVWVVVVCLVVFPFFSNNTTKVKMVQTATQMSKSFIEIIKVGLKIPDQSNQNPNEVVLNIPSEREKKCKEIRTSIRNIRMTLDSMKSSLLDVKMELIFSPKKSLEFYQVYDILNSTFTRLVASETSLLKVGFSDQLLNAMIQINEPLSIIFQSIQFIDNDLLETKKKKKKTKDLSMKQENLDQNLLDSLKGLSESFQVVRMDLLKRKLLAGLHPEMIQFGSGMYSIHDYIKHYSALYKHLNIINNK